LEKLVIGLIVNNRYVNRAPEIWGYQPEMINQSSNPEVLQFSTHATRSFLSKIMIKRLSPVVKNLIEKSTM
jgi:hypothetical protein